MKITLNKNNSSEDRYNFWIEGISNLLIQNLLENKNTKIEIKSSEDLLKLLKKEYAFSSLDTLRASKYISLTNIKDTNDSLVKELEKLRVELQSNIDEDFKEYSLPNSFKTNITLDIKKDETKSILNKDEKLRSGILKALPKEDKKLFI